MLTNRLFKALYPTDLAFTCADMSCIDANTPIDSRSTPMYNSVVMNQANPMRAIVIGLGRIGLLYDAQLDPDSDWVLTHTRACMTHPSIYLVGGVDPDAQRRETFSRVTGQTAFASVAQAVSSVKEADIVIIATPTGLREMVIASCWQLNPKLVLIEKPLATTLEEAQRIVQACEEKNVQLAVNYQRRFDPAFQELRQFLREGQIGQLCGGYCYYTGDALNHASHFVDLMIYLIGKPLSVECIPGHSSEYGHSFLCRYERASIYFIPLDTEYGMAEMDLLFEHTRVRLENYSRNIQVYRPEEDSIFAGHQRLGPNQDVLTIPDSTRYQYQVIDGLLKNMARSEQPVSNGVTAMATLACCLKGTHATQGVYCQP